MSTRHLELACRHVSDAWFPLNPETLAKIRKGIDSGLYEHDIDELVSEIRSDYSLYIYCLKELAKKIDVEGGLSPRGRSPAQIMKDSGLAELKEILSFKSEPAPTHTIKNLTEVQAQRLQQALTSATVAETIACKIEINADSAYCCGLLRQLGLTLIAWNYPHVYTKSLAKLSNSTESLDVILTRALGFSPMSLSISLARSWNLAPEILGGMGDSAILDNIDISRGIKNAATTLSKICEVGEALARASDPETYPSATSDWSSAAQAITSYLGPDGLGLVQRRVKEACASYLDANPDLFDLDALSQINDGGPPSDYAQKLLARNTYVKNCAPIIQMQISDTYHKLHPDLVSRDALDSLIKETLPLAGFSQAAIFMLEPFSFTLVPVIKTGTNCTLPTNAIKLNSSEVDQNPIALAFRCGTPINQEMTTEIGEKIPIIAGVLGNTQRTGVLLVRISKMFEQPDAPDPIATFKALRQCMLDCLRIT